MVCLPVILTAGRMSVVRRPDPPVARGRRCVSRASPRCVYRVSPERRLMTVRPGSLWR